jgi:hypothetical protein
VKKVVQLVCDKIKDNDFKHAGNEYRAAVLAGGRKLNVKY